MDADKSTTSLPQGSAPDEEEKNKKKLISPGVAAICLAVICAVLAAVTAVTWTSYRQRNDAVLAENQRLETDLAAQQAENEAIQAELDRLAREEQALKARAEELKAFLEDDGALRLFLTDGKDLETYIREQLLTLLEQRQNLVNGIHIQMTANLNAFFADFGAAEYVPPEPVDVGQAFFKDVVSSVIGEIDPSGIFGDVAAQVVESGGRDLWDTVSSAMLESIGDKIAGSVQDAILEATGLDRLISAANSANSVFSALNDIFDHTPDYALALTLQDASDHARQVMAVLNDPNANVDDLQDAVYAYNQFCAYRRAAMDLRDEVGLTSMSEFPLYGHVAQIRAIDQAIGIYTILLLREDTP